MSKQDRDDRAADRMIDAALRWELGCERPDEAAVENEGAQRQEGGGKLLQFLPRIAMVAAGLLIVGVVGTYLVKERSQLDESGAESTGSNSAVSEEGELEVDGVEFEEVAEEEEEAAIVGSEEEIRSLPNSLSSVEAEGDWFKDSALALLVQRCPELTQIRLRDVAITGDGLRELTKLGRLRILRLPNCARIYDRDIDTLLQLKNLNHLDLSGFVGQTAMVVDGFGKSSEDYVSPESKLTGDAIGRLGELPSLNVLKLSGTQLDDAALRNILAQNPKILHLDVSYTRLTNASLGELANLAGLKRLEAKGWGHLDDEAAAQFGRLVQLRWLEFGGNPFMPERLSVSAMSQIASLQKLQVLGIQSITADSEGWQALGGLGNLSRLMIGGCGVIDAAAIEAFSRLPKLGHLALRGTKVSLVAAITELGAGRRFSSGPPAALEPLVGMTTLRYLDITGSRTWNNDQMLEKLAKAGEGRLTIKDPDGVRLALPTLRVAAKVPVRLRKGAVAVSSFDAKGRVADNFDPYRDTLPRAQTIGSKANPAYRFVEFKARPPHESHRFVRVYASGQSVVEHPIELVADAITRLEVEPQGSLLGKVLTCPIHFSFENIGEYRPEHLQVVAILDMEKEYCVGIHRLYAMDNGNSIQAYTRPHKLRLLTPGNLPLDVEVPKDADRVTFDLSKLSR